MSIKEILQRAVEERASDVFIVAGLPVSVRNNGVIVKQYDERLFPPDTELLLKEIHMLPGRDLSILRQAR